MTEAYDPITNSWSQLPNATHAFSSYAATVFNDEIIIHGGYESSGWSGTASDKTYGYDPFINEWNVRATLPIGMYDSTLALANDTMIYASGDSSNNRFGTWSIQYLAANDYHVNPSSREGLLTSSIRTFVATRTVVLAPLAPFQFLEPSGTMIGLQYRTASSQQGIASAAWLPTTVPVNTYFSAANLSLTDVRKTRPICNTV